MKQKTHTFDNKQELKSVLSSLPEAEFRSVQKGKVVQKEGSSQNFRNKLEELEVPTHEIDEDAESDAVLIYNRDTGKLASQGTPQYDIIQHREAIEPVVEALDELGLEKNGRIEVRNGGNVVKYTGQTGREFEVNGEKYAIGFQLVNTYNKSSSVSLKGFYVRQICSNGMIGRENLGVGELRRQHRGDVEIVEEYKEWFENLLETDRVQQIISQAQSDFFDREDIIRVLGNVDLPETKYDEIAELIEPNSQQSLEIPEGKVTRKQLYDAVTNYITHELSDVAVATEERYHKKAVQILVLDKGILTQKIEIEEPRTDDEEEAERMREKFETKQKQIQTVVA